jgi:hypothetical protein
MNSLTGLRFVLLITVWASTSPSPAGAQTVLPSPLSIGDVIRLAGERCGEIQAARARVRAGEQRPAIVSALDDPMFSPSLDHLPFMLGGADVSFTFEQQIPLSGIRGPWSVLAPPTRWLRGAAGWRCSASACPSGATSCTPRGGGAGHARDVRSGLRAMTRMIEGDAAAAVSQLQATGDRQAALTTDVLPRARMAIEPAVAGYTAGQLPLVSVIEAVQALWLVQGDLIAADTELDLAWARLGRAIGSYEAIVQ